MSEHHEPDASQHDANGDSKTDAIAAVALIGIAVVTMIFWVSNQ